VFVDAETDESALVITGIKGRINRAVWGPLNRTIITAGEDATIRIWDSEVSMPAGSIDTVNRVYICA
jgi:WD40 repeat protein